MLSDKYGLTQAVLDGRKTMTRRMVTQRALEKVKQFQLEYYNATLDVIEGKELLEQYFFVEKLRKKPYDVGEVVAITQSYFSIAEYLEDPRNASCMEHFEKNLSKAAWYACVNQPGFSNKMFVSSEKMPHHIRITDIKIERLQDISEEECLKEGIYQDSGDDQFPPSVFYDYENNTDDGFDTAKEAFASLIDKVSGKGTWLKNPYVFCYSFKLID